MLTTPPLRLGEGVCEAGPLASSKAQTGATREQYGDSALLDNTTSFLYRLHLPAKQGLDVKAQLKRSEEEGEVDVCVSRYF